jgi:hypothetical protein
MIPSVSGSRARKNYGWDLEWDGGNDRGGSPSRWVYFLRCCTRRFTDRIEVMHRGLALLLVSALAIPESRASAVPLTTVRVAANLAFPVYVTSPPGDPRLFIVEQAGRIKILENGSVLSRPFLDIASQVNSVGQEQGPGTGLRPCLCHFPILLRVLLRRLRSWKDRRAALSRHA